MFRGGGRKAERCRKERRGGHEKTILKNNCSDECLDVMHDISDAISMPIGSADGQIIDEDALEAELEALMQEHICDSIRSLSSPFSLFPLPYLPFSYLFFQHHSSACSIEEVSTRLR